MGNISKIEYPDYFNKLNQSSSFIKLKNIIDSKQSAIFLEGLNGSTKPLIACAISSILNKKILYVANEKHRLEEVKSDIKYFTGKDTPSLAGREPAKPSGLFAIKPLETVERMNWLALAESSNLTVVERFSLYEYVCPKPLLEHSVIEIRVNDEINRDNLIRELREIGYLKNDFVQAYGEFGVRGSIIDIFPPTEKNPLRIEMLGDTVNSLRNFSIQNQKSIKKIEHVNIVPASEIILNIETLNNSIRYLQKKFEEDEISYKERKKIIENIKNNIRIQNINWLIPLFYKELSTTLDYISTDTIIIYDDQENRDSHMGKKLYSIEQKLRGIKNDIKFIPPLSELYLDEGILNNSLKKYQSIFMGNILFDKSSENTVRFDVVSRPIQNLSKVENPTKILSREIKKLESLKYKTELSFSSDSQYNTLIKLLGNSKNKYLSYKIGNLSSGFIFHNAKLAILCGNEIFGRKQIRDRNVINDIPSAFITSFSELKTGDLIVHKEFGIGLFIGLKHIKLKDAEGDFIECEYLGGDKIFVPVHRFKLVQRYIGDNKTPKLDKLGNKAWNSRVKKVKRIVETIAVELVELYAKRKSEKGFKFSKGDTTYREFEYDFPYEETPDQKRAIDDVIIDMETPKPMERLICGDVGFGKTEVSLRAAFKAVMDSKQVAILVPTTLLAQQHYHTSVERLKKYPVLIETFTRFKTPKNEKQILERLANGKIDIIIGTHKLLSNKVNFKDLGLVVIDEEHRFGVQHKEKFKKLKTGVDVLALSATPIPRTLQLSLTNIRDISIINTPPEGRQSIETNIDYYSDELVKKAVMRELERNGTVFFIHNRIQDINKVSSRLKELIPNATIDITHGRMNERSLEKSMTDFINGTTGILVTTAIVESGLDIPRANTIFINNAQQMGLADLYQLRGRVGRSDKKAYSYFLVPRKEKLTKEARKRLKSISELTDLGSGYKVAMSDLEIRGAGNLFGTEQSGNIADVGLEMYMEMLDNAIKQLNSDYTKDDFECEIKSQIPAYISDKYIEDSSQRLLIYKRLSSISSFKDLQEIRNEMADRFGNIPLETENLLKTIQLRIVMKKLKIPKIEIKQNEIVISFSRLSECYKMFTPSGKLTLIKDKDDALDQILKRLRDVSGTMGA